MRSSLALLLAVLAAPAAAAVARPTSVEALARGADAVVRGRVEARESRVAEDGRHVYTLVTVRVAEVWRGAAPDRLVLRVPGGEVGRFGQRVDAAPVFEDREEVVVFASRDRAGGFQVHGLALGKFRVEGATARPDLGGFRFVEGRLPAGERPVEAMALDELRRRVGAAR